MYKKVLGIVLIMAATPALAGDLSYSYLGGSYQSIEIDLGPGSDPDGDGLAVEFSFDIANNWYLLGEYGKADLNLGFDYDATSFGAGYHAPFSDRVDMYAALTYENRDFGFDDDSGFGMAVGVRAYASDKVELQGRVSYIDVGPFDDTSIGGTALYEFNDRFALGLDVDAGDITIVGLTARFYFTR